MIRRIALLLTAFALLVAACGGGDDAVDTTTAAVATAQRIEQVFAQEAAALLADAPDGLVVLDVRTLDEFNGGHIADATMLDFYAAEFQDRLAGLDRDTPYFVYCRSGNRSGTTRDLMRHLGFTEVYELDGGINSWVGAGLPIE